MKKKFALLAKSPKCKNLCIAGVDLETQDFIRIVSQEEDIEYAVRHEDAMYDERTPIQLHDIIKCECVSKDNNTYQPENYINDDQYYWANGGEFDLSNLLNMNILDREEYIFYNTSRALAPSEIDNIKAEERYSLMLIKPQEAYISVQDNPWNEWGHKKIRMNIKYKDRWYYNISVTDTKITNKYDNYNINEYKLEQDVILFISLGELHKETNKHYKLVTNCIFV
ncbi:dual OB domain-containing protein [Fusibacter sp. JL298sf-3]